MKILCFGSCGIDYSYWIDSPVKAGEEIGAKKFERLPGGRGLKQAVSIAKSGEEVFFAGCIGKDGLFLKEYLEEAGVNTEHLKISSSPQSHAVKQRYGDNGYSLISYGQTNKEIDREYIDRVLSNFGSGDIILLQNKINNLDYIIEKAYFGGMRIVLNASPFKENLREIDLNKVEILILNEKEAEELTGLSEIKDISEYFKTKYKDLSFLLTLGAVGGIYFNTESEFGYPSYSVTSEAAGSSGDTFIGYFVSGIKCGLPLEKNLKRASCASALVVISKRNNMPPSVPSIEEVEEALETLKPNKKHTLDTEKNRKAVLRYIEENFASPSLSELAKVLGYSKSYTTLWIKKYMDSSFSDMVKDKRCEFAAELLLKTDMPIESIIRQTGCENGSFFRRIFKERYGKNLLDYRNCHTKKE